MVKILYLVFAMVIQLAGLAMYLQPTPDFDRAIYFTLVAIFFQIAAFGNRE